MGVILCARAGGKAGCVVVCDCVCVCVCVVLLCVPVLLQSAS